MADKIKQPRVVQTAFLSFLENHPPAQFSSNLRRMLLDHIRHELKEGVIPVYLDEFLRGLNDLIDLLDMAAKEFPHACSSKNDEKG